VEVPFDCDEWKTTATARVRQAIADAMPIIPTTDAQMLDWLDRQTGSRKLHWRKHAFGWRLHETSCDDGAVPTVREAIATAMWNKTVAEADRSKAVMRSLVHDMMTPR